MLKLLIIIAITLVLIVNPVILLEVNRNSINIPSLLTNKDLTLLDDEALGKYADLLVKSLVPFYLKDALETQDLSSEFLSTISSDGTCFKHLRQFLEEISKVLLVPNYVFNTTAVWALQMVDSWGKIPEGILSGHLNTYGDWDECVNIRSPNTVVYDESPFRGKYCFTYLVPNVLTSPAQRAVSPPELIGEIMKPVVTQIMPSVATCIPSSCSREEFEALAFTLFNGTGLVPYVILCETDEKPSLDTGAICMIAVLSILTSLILIGTVLDASLGSKENLKHLKQKTIVQIMIAFSLITNVKKWADTSSSEGGFGCIHGLRFLSTCWVLLSHTIFMISMQLPAWNTIDVNHIYEKKWPFYFILNGFFSVDTFFTMSGLLAAYSILRALEKSGGRLNPLKLYLHRFLRITPTYAFIIGIFANLYRYLGEGPNFASLADSIEKACRKYWWHNLLYFNNLYDYNLNNGEVTCEGESWYIANDMQFFILCPLFMMVLYKWKHFGMGLLGAASLASILTPGIVTGVNNLAPTMIFWKIGLEENDVYKKPWHRIGPYLVGMWMGYILFKIGKKPVKLPKLAVIGGWMLSTSTALALLIGVMPYYQPDHKGNAVGAGFYAGLSKFVWGIVICWIIFACSKGYGGWVNSFLSWKAFVPLGRLAFCVYLSSFSIQYLLQMTLTQPEVFDMYNTVNIFFSHVIMCFLVGFVFTLAFESPFIALEKIIFAPKQAKKAGECIMQTTTD